MQSGHTWIQNQEGSILHLGPRSVVPPQQTSYLLDLASIPSPLPWAHLGHPSYLQQTLFILQVLLPTNLCPPQPPCLTCGYSRAAVTEHGGLHPPVYPLQFGRAEAAILCPRLALAKGPPADPQLLEIAANLGL